MNAIDKKIVLILKLNQKLVRINDSLSTINFNVNSPTIQRFELERFNTCIKAKINITTVLSNLNYLNY